jgi:arylsulfate sulfotransferase
MMINGSLNRSAVWVVFLILIDWACREDAELRNEVIIAHVRLALENARNENNLIVRIDKDMREYRIHFESGGPLTLQEHFVGEVLYDSGNWLVLFKFSDQTSQAAHFVGKLDIDDDDIFLDPHLVSPLAALAMITVPVKGKFKVSVKGKTSGGVTIENIFGHYSEEHELPVLGLYEDYANQVEFVFMSDKENVRCSKSITIQTLAIPNKPALDIDIIKNQLGDSYAGLYVISNLSVGFDQTGAIRWYYNGEGSSFFGKLRNGNFLVAEASNLSFFEVTMVGQRVNTYHVPNGLHHEIVELPNGNFLVASHSPPGHPLEDVVDEVSRTTRHVIRSWDFNNILDPKRKALPNVWEGDWLHINALYYDETDNSIVISGRSQCSVAKIDYITGSLKWILSNPNEWGPSFASFLLKPVDHLGNELNAVAMDFWPYGQHAVHRMPNGNLLLYDNGDYRGYYDDPHVSPDSYTRLVEYTINEQQKTVELVWQFDNNKSVFTRFTGYTQNLKATRLAAYMWVSAYTPRIVEVDINNLVVYEATINQGKISYYRTAKIDVYAGLD